MTGHPGHAHTRPRHSSGRPNAYVLSRCGERVSERTVTRLRGPRVVRRRGGARVRDRTLPLRGGRTQKRAQCAIDGGKCNFFEVRGEQEGCGEIAAAMARAWWRRVAGGIVRWYGGRIDSWGRRAGRDPGAICCG